MKVQNTFIYTHLNKAIAASLCTLSTAQIFVQFINSSPALSVSRVAFLALCICMLPHFKFREWALLVGCGLLTLGLLNKIGGADSVLFALDRAAFFAAFIYLVTLLKEAAQRSPSVLKLGEYLANQPPGRRYYSLSFGGHIAGILLNFGAISLIAPLVQRGAHAQDSVHGKTLATAKILEQQQVSALTRGFTWMVMWSPTSLAQVVLFTTVPDADIRITLPLGIAATISMIFLGRLEDRLRWRNKITEPFGETIPFPTSAALRFSAVCFALIIPTVLVSHIANVSVVIALMLVAPALVVTWFIELSQDQKLRNKLKNAGREIVRMLSSSSSVFGHSAIALGLAGFIGVTASELAPIHVFSTYLDVHPVPEWIILVSLPAIILACGQIALSPILVVVFLGSILNQIDVPVADPNLVFFALGSGWALSMLASPNASATLLLSGITRIPPTVLTWRWNGLYAAMCFTAFAVSFGLLSTF